MSRGLRMAAEVSHVAFKLAAVVGCVSCGIGIAVDMVGKRWGEDAYDWQGERFGHACSIVRSGLTLDQRTAVAALEHALESWSHSQRGGGGGFQSSIDPRLPPERDEPETNA